MTRRTGTTGPVNTIPQAELRDRLTGILDDVKWRSKVYVVTRRGRPWAQIVPLDTASDAEGEDDGGRT